MNRDLLVDGLEQIVDMIGIENMSDSKKVLALFGDCKPEGKMERKALRLVYESGAADVLLANDGAGDQYVCLRAADMLKTNTLMDETIANELIVGFCLALNIKYSIAVESSSAEPENKVVTTPEIKAVSEPVSKAVTKPDIKKEVAQKPSATTYVTKDRPDLEAKRRELQKYSKYIVSSGGDSAGLTEDGRVVSTFPSRFSSYRRNISEKNNKVVHILSQAILGHSKDINDIRYWTDIVSIDMSENHIVGIKKNGKVLACGSNRSKQCNVKGWNKITKVACAHYHTAGLKRNGEIVVCGKGIAKSVRKAKWHNLVDVVSGYSYVAGLCDNGKVFKVLSDSAKYNRVRKHMHKDYNDGSDWEDVAKLQPTAYEMAGILSDGSVVGLKSLTDWRDIVDIARYHESSVSPVVGLKKDGHVVVAVNKYSESQYADAKQWRDIVQVANGSNHIVGLRADGTVVACGKNDEKQCDVSSWKDIVYLSCGMYHTLGLKNDGTVVACGSGNDSEADFVYSNGQCGVENWKLF